MERDSTLFAREFFGATLPQRVILPGELGLDVIDWILVGNQPALINDTLDASCGIFVDLTAGEPENPETGSGQRFIPLHILEPLFTELMLCSVGFYDNGLLENHDIYQVTAQKQLLSSESNANCLESIMETLLNRRVDGRTPHGGKPLQKTLPGSFPEFICRRSTLVRFPPGSIPFSSSGIPTAPNLDARVCKDMPNGGLTPLEGRHKRLQGFAVRIPLNDLLLLFSGQRFLTFDPCHSGTVPDPARAVVTDSLSGERHAHFKVASALSTCPVGPDREGVSPIQRGCSLTRHRVRPPPLRDVELDLGLRA